MYIWVGDHPVYNDHRRLVQEAGKHRKVVGIDGFDLKVNKSVSDIQIEVERRVVVTRKRSVGTAWPKWVEFAFFDGVHASAVVAKCTGGRQGIGFAFTSSICVCGLNWDWDA